MYSPNPDLDYRRRLLQNARPNWLFMHLRALRDATCLKRRRGGYAYRGLTQLLTWRQMMRGQLLKLESNRVDPRLTAGDGPSPGS